MKSTDSEPQGGGMELEQYRTSLEQMVEEKSKDLPQRFGKERREIPYFGATGRRVLPEPGTRLASNPCQLYRNDPVDRRSDQEIDRIIESQRTI